MSRTSCGSRFRHISDKLLVINVVTLTVWRWPLEFYIRSRLSLVAWKATEHYENAQRLNFNGTFWETCNDISR